MGSCTPKPRPKPTSRVRVIPQTGTRIEGRTDYYCDYCGKAEVDVNYPHTHSCGPKVMSFVEHRRSVCRVCPHNQDGICQKLKEKTPDLPCNIKVGTKQFKSRCPLNHWLAIRYFCIHCLHETVNLNGVWSCENCGKDGEPLNPLVDLVKQPFTNQVRNLIFHFYPRYEEPTGYHLEQLAKSIDSFNGERICWVATDSRTMHSDISSDLDRLFTQVHYGRNDRAGTELLGFSAALEELETTSPEETIVYAHSKGMRPHTNDSQAVRLWTQAMYDTVVHNPAEMKAAFENGFNIAGAFKRHGHFNVPFTHHYSGTFWEVRSRALYSREWRDLSTLHNYTVERYPGVHFADLEAYCAFGEDAQGSLYEMGTWNAGLLNELEAWRDQHTTS